MGNGLATVPVIAAARRLLLAPWRAIGVARLVACNLRQLPEHVPPEDDGGPVRRR